MAYRGSNNTIVWVLIALNLILFITTTIQRAASAEPSLIYTLGLWQYNFWERPWTLITSMFLHANVWHILANMVTLYFFGSYLARLLGLARLLIIYFGGGILGGIIYLLLPPTPMTIAIGASGAVFALGGTLAVMRPKLRVFVFPIPAPLPLWVAVIGGFIIISIVPNVAWQAHLGGLVFGSVIGYFFRRRERYYY
jgi:membrane associated rhomboid family serine protease